MIIDIHAHIWKGRVDSDKSLLINTAKRCDIDRIYVSALSGYFPNKEEIDELNHEVAKFINEEPKLIGGAVYINPDNDNTIDIIKRGIEEQRMEIIKIWVSTYVNSKSVYSIAKTAIDYNVPILIHAMHKANGQVANENTAENIAILAKRYPELKIIMAHMGGNVYNGISTVADLKNVFVDISFGVVRDNDLPYCIRQLGADRILFGTDMPGVSYNKKIAQVLDGDLTKDENDRIFYKNAQDLLGLKGV